MSTVYAGKEARDGEYIHSQKGKQSRRAQCDFLTKLSFSYSLTDLQLPRRGSGAGCHRSGPFFPRPNFAHANYKFHFRQFLCQRGC